LVFLICPTDAYHTLIRRPTGGFYDTALSEASKFELRKILPRPAARPNNQGVPKAPA